MGGTNHIDGVWISIRGKQETGNRLMATKTRVVESISRQLAGGGKQGKVVSRKQRRRQEAGRTWSLR
jgi:hypothetical protein